MLQPRIGEIVLYRTDGRNGLTYDLPAMITCTAETHPGDYPDGAQNPLPVPESDLHVHLTVFTPGGYGSYVNDTDDASDDDSSQFVGAESFVPGSGTYVEHNVPFFADPDDITPDGWPEPDARTWRWQAHR